MYRQDETSQTKVSLDQLLSLKKHEKPSPEFWEDFNKQLHARSLQALALRKKRFSFSQIWSTFLRIFLSPAVPMAAAASLVMTLAMPSLFHVADSTSFSAKPTLSEQCAQTYFVQNCIDANCSSQEQFANTSLGAEPMPSFVAQNVASVQDNALFSQPYTL